MIYIGYSDQEKQIEIAKYQATHDITRTVIISADKFPLPILGTQQEVFSDVIEYVTFYRLLQEVDSHTLIVLNECLRTQNRYELTYNCIRNFLNQTSHQLIFQQLPLIDTREDFMILFDFDTRSRWKRQGFDLNLILDNATVKVAAHEVSFTRIDVPTSKATQKRYQSERDALFGSIGLKDPHTLPRNLYLLGGKDKLAYITNQQMPLFGKVTTDRYISRNKRLGDAVTPYSDAIPGEQYIIVEFPHRFIDFSDFIKMTCQFQSQVLVAGLKVDDWYFNRYQEWGKRINETCTDLQQR